MAKYKIEKLSMPALAMALAGLFVSVVSIVLCVLDSNGDGPLYSLLSMFSLACYIILVAGLSTKKAGLVRTFIILMISFVILTSFIISIVNISRLSIATTKGIDLILLLIFALCLFVDSILFLIYYLNKNEEIVPLKKLTNILLVLFSGAYFVTDLIIQLVGKVYTGFQFGLTGMLLLLIMATLSPLFIDKAIVPNIKRPGIEEEPKVVDVEEVK